MLKEKLATAVGVYDLPRVKIAPSRQVVIPKKFWDLLHLKPGDLLDVEFDWKKNALVYTPKEVVDKTTTAKKDWIRGLIQAAKEQPIDISEDEIVADKKIKKQLFKEKYGVGKKK